MPRRPATSATARRLLLLPTKGDAMKTMMMIPASLCFVVSGLGSAHADVAVGIAAQLVVSPSVPTPALLPVVPMQPPPPPVPVYSARSALVTTPAVSGGQWVYTSQYGWLYIPYGSHYVVTHATGPHAYVYYPSRGWRWVSSPWVVGAGPFPYFGANGPHAYDWFRRLDRAGHPMATHYARPSYRPFVAPRASAPARPVHVARPVAPHSPGRAVGAPRAVAGPQTGVAWRRNHAAPTRVAYAPGARR